LSEKFLDLLNDLEMDFDYLKIVLNDFTLKQLFIINWLDNNLDKNLQHRNEKILRLLSEHCNESLHDWTALKIGQALMAINELGFLNQSEIKKLDSTLCTYLLIEKCPNTIVKPFVKECCDKKLDMKLERNITIFTISKSYPATMMNGTCNVCRRKYSNNYYIDGKQKFVTYESIFGNELVYFGGAYGYAQSLIKWLSNSIQYLYSGFENFSKCYNATQKWMVDNLGHKNEANLSPTRIQDFWFLYNFVTISFFYTNKKILKITSTW
jgi:hypothetical protein